MTKRYTIIDAARHLRQMWSLHITPMGLEALLREARGPAVRNATWGPAYDVDDLDRWALYHFGPRRSADPRIGEYQAPSWNPPAPGAGPSWLVVCEPSPDADYWHDQLTAFGGNVTGPVDCPALAMEHAARGNFDAAVLCMDDNVEAAILVAAALIEWRIPYLFVTRFREVPTTILLGGTPLLVPYDFEDVAHVIERRMPANVVDRMDLSKLIPVDGDAEWIDPPTHPTAVRCWYHRKGICGCRSWDPKCANAADAAGQHGDQPDLFQQHREAAE